MAEIPEKIRRIEPFGYWPQFASALQGFGGEEGGPDPFYCFHTPYLEYQPGGLIFRMRLVGASATTGELSLRVHAFRSDGTMDAVLVGGSRVSLEGLDGDEEFSVRVASLPGVSYAFLARYSQPSDLQIRDLVISAEELADEDANTYGTVELKPSNFGAVNLQTPAHLTTIGEPTLQVPLSQPWTKSQGAEVEALERLPPGIRAIPDPNVRWRTAFAWQALSHYGMVQPGASGCVLTTGGDSPLRQLLQDRGVLVADQVPGEASAGLDFVVDLDALHAAPDGKHFNDRVLERMTSLARGGLGVFLFDARLGGLSAASPAVETAAPWVPGEQDIQRIALHVIGHNSEIAQIVWPRDRDRLGVTPFGLLARR